MEDLPDRKAYLKATQQTDGIAVLEATATWCSQCKAIFKDGDPEGSVTGAKGDAILKAIREVYPKDKEVAVE